MLQEELRLYDASCVSVTPRAASGARDGLSDSASSVHSDLAAAVAADMDDVPSDYRHARSGASACCLPFHAATIALPREQQFLLRLLP